MSTERSFPLQTLVLVSLGSASLAFAASSFLTSRYHRSVASKGNRIRDELKKASDEKQEAAGKPKGKLMESSKIDEGKGGKEC